MAYGRSVVDGVHAVAARRAPDRSVGLSSSPRGPRLGLRRGGYPSRLVLDSALFRESGAKNGGGTALKRGVRARGQPSSTTQPA